MSGLIPQPFIDELLQRTDLVEFIDGYLPLKKRGASYLTCCPFHNEKTPSFNVVAKKQFYHCFGCGASGNAISFAMNYLNQGFTQAVETLAGRLGLTVPREGQVEKNLPDYNLYKLLAEVSQYYQNNLKKCEPTVKEYLNQRGLDEEVMKVYQLGYALEGWHHLEKKFHARQDDLLTTGMLIKNDEAKIYDRYRNRLMFPIHDRHGRIIGFGGRVFDDSQKPKYLNSPETILFQKNRELYGLHQILSREKQVETILVVEGYMDVIALAQHDIKNAVATLGTATSPYHIQLLAKHTKKIIFCFDGDEAGKQAAWRALESSLGYLNEGLDAGFIFLPQGQDPDSLVRTQGRATFLQLLEEAMPLHQFLLHTLGKNLNLLHPAGRTQLINAAKPYLQKMTEGSYKEFLLTQLARITHIDQHRLSQLVADTTPTKTYQHTSITRTPLRIATALLLQNPEIYEQSKHTIDMQCLDKQSHGVLLQLLQQLASNPKANTASLLEAWRQDKHFDFLSQLTAWEHQVPEEALLKEFIDTLLFLQRQHQELRVNQLIDKSRHQGLTEEERLVLQTLLKKKHDKKVF